MNFISKFWNSFKLNPDIWVFYGFLLTSPFSIRKVLFFYPIDGQFNEYTGIYIYLSDIFLFLIINSWVISILYNKLLYKSIGIEYFVAFLKQKFVVIPLLLVILSFISVFWSTNWQVAIFRSIKLLEFYFLFLWVIFRMFHMEHKNNNRYFIPAPWQQHVSSQKECSTWNIIKNSTILIVFMGIFQSIIAIWQFINQKSIGLIWLKESLIYPDISGVAKIVLDGEKYIRAYGLFPHPNILGGFLVLSIMLTFAFFKPLDFLRNLKNEQKMFHVEHKNNNKCSTYLINKRAWNIYYVPIILVIQIVALILTFSKSAWIGLAIAFLYLCLKSVSFPERCSISRKMFHVEHLKCFALLAVIFLLIIVITKPDLYSVVGKGIEDRLLYLNVSRGTFLENPILGIGIGQYVYQLVNIPGIQNWQFQPVHNVFLLILNEIGIIGLSLFVWFVWEVIKNVPRGTFKAIFFGFLFIMLVDHYFWDIQQGQIMLWLILAILVGGKMWASNKLDTYPQVKGVNIDK